MVSDISIKRGTISIDAVVCTKVGNVGLKIRRDLGEWIQKTFFTGIIMSYFLPGA